MVNLKLVVMMDSEVVVVVDVEVGEEVDCWVIEQGRVTDNGA